MKTAVADHVAKETSQAVAFQFTLDTFIVVYREALAMQQVISRHFGYPLAAPAFGAKSQRILKQLFDALMLLTTQLADYLPTTKEHQQGPLVELGQECQKLSAATHSHKDAAHLYLLADRAWLEAHQALQAYTHGERHGSGDQTDTSKRLPFLGHIVKMIKTLERFSKTWPKLFREFRSNENVLLFLVRRRHDLDTLHGSKFVKGVLEPLFPEGPSELESYLLEAYARRGFSHLSTTILSSIEELGSW